MPRASRGHWRDGGWPAEGEAWDGEWRPPPAPSIWALAARDDVAGLEEALGRAGAQEHAELLGAQSSNGWTPLHVAAIEGAAGAAELLLRHRADPLARSGYLSPTPLHLAAWHGHISVAKALLARGARCDAPNGLGEIPLEKARQRGKAEMEQLLLAAGSPGARPGRERYTRDPHVLTARHIAACRATESARPDALFNDALASMLAGEEGWGYGGGRARIVPPRTRFFDDFVRERYERGVRQFVLLGAGMDTRAFRIEGIPEARFFEVDKPPLFEAKEPLLREACAALAVAARSTVGLDLAAAEPDALQGALRQAGLDPQRPSAWILEGLVMYLSPSDVQRLMAQVAALAALGSAVIHDAVSGSNDANPFGDRGAPFLSGHDDYGGLWAAHGFDRAEVVDVDHDLYVDRATKSLWRDPRRPPYRPQDACGWKLNLFVVAEKTRVT